MPDKVIVCGLPGALSVIVTVELRAPVVDGVKVTLIVQVAFVASVAAQVLVCAKSPALPPEIAMELIVNCAASNIR